MKSSILRDQHFRPVSETKVDSKNRVCLPKKVQGAAHTYRIYSNDAGQIILDPQVLVPASEAWLYRNEEALGAVRQGLEEAKAGRLVKRKSLVKHADDSLDAA